jgi:lipopolysaccharide/colanic/teichoic acid biosynthesis glycosyltransferase
MATYEPVLRKQIKKDAQPNRLSIDAFQPQRKPVGQDTFLQMLRLERRRTERSGRPFILVLISGEDLQGTISCHWANDVTTALSACIRETDALGWYEQQAFLGLLMTEILDASPGTIEAIVQRISRALQGRVPSEIYCRLTLIVRVFPEDGEDRVFYPDHSRDDDSKKIDRSLKRVTDIAGSAIALLFCAPIFLVIAIAIKCTSEGPIFFCQNRVGRLGKEFCFYKFRTMSANNDPRIHHEYVAKLIAGGADSNRTDGLYKLTNDPRITKVGGFLRRTSLDELPQFFNVLMNDMSLVGPRPPLPYEYERYQTWHKRRVWEFKPGITGLWQIEGRSRTTFDEMVRMDIRYAKIRSFWVDLKIMWQTPTAMFLGHGAC